jgi:hypothetical protein
MMAKRKNKDSYFVAALVSMLISLTVMLSIGYIDPETPIYFKTTMSVVMYIMLHNLLHNLTRD